MADDHDISNNSQNLTTPLPRHDIQLLSRGNAVIGGTDIVQRDLQQSLVLDQA